MPQQIVWYGKNNLKADKKPWNYNKLEHSVFFWFSDTKSVFHLSGSDFSICSTKKKKKREKKEDGIIASTVLFDKKRNTSVFSCGSSDPSIVFFLSAVGNIFLFFFVRCLVYNVGESKAVLSAPPCPVWKWKLC